MRVLAEHARSSTMLVSDGVFPSNEGRGYVLRRIIRRAVRYAYLLGTEQLVMPRLVETAIDVMGNAYPDVVKNRDFLVGVLTREEERFRHTLKTGLTILDDELESGERCRVRRRSCCTTPTASRSSSPRRSPANATIDVDLAGFQSEMTAQRERAKAARKDTAADDGRLEAYREVVEQFGVTEFLGYTDDETQSRVLAGPGRYPTTTATNPSTWSRSSSTAPRSTPRAAARSATPARSRPTPGVGRGARHDVRPAEPTPPHGPDHRRHR